MKLFQWITGDKDKKARVSKIIDETLHIFARRDQIFGMKKVYTPFSDTGEKLPVEEKKIVTTVQERLNWTAKFMEDMIDHEVTRDWANTRAFAEIEFGGTKVKLPATSLLSLGSRLEAWRRVLEAIPTLDATREWVPEGDKFINGPITTYRTAKVTKVIEMAKATDRHPAQVKEVVADEQIGSFSTITVTGEIPSIVKAELIERCDLLIAKVKQALKEANTVEVEEVRVGKFFLDFIRGR